MAYREEDRSELAAFKQHIEIAETLLGVNADLSEQLVSDTDDDGELRRARGETWGNLWEQLVQARTIVARLGRDVGPFDAERARAGNPYHVAAGMARIEEPMRVATRAAIDALRVAIPEVVIPVAAKTPTPADTGIPRRPAASHFRMTPMVWAQVGSFVAIVLVALARC